MKFCTSCHVVLVTDSYSDLCQGCIDDILSWLFWPETDEQELSDYMDRLEQEDLQAMVQEQDQELSDYLGYMVQAYEDSTCQSYVSFRIEGRL